MVAHTLVDAFVVTCKNNQIALHRQLVGDVLVEAFTIGRSENHFVVVALSLQRRDAAIDGLALHHHACATSVGIVVHTAPLVECVVSQIVQTNLCKSFLLGSRQYTLVYEAFQHFGQYGDDVDSHF